MGEHFGVREGVELGKGKGWEERMKETLVSM